MAIAGRGEDKIFWMECEARDGALRGLEAMDGLAAAHVPHLRSEIPHHYHCLGYVWETIEEEKRIIRNLYGRPGRPGNYRLSIGCPFGDSQQPMRRIQSEHRLPLPSIPYP